MPEILRTFRAQVFGAPGRSGGRTLVAESHHGQLGDAELVAIHAVIGDHRNVVYIRDETTDGGRLVASIFRGCWVWDRIRARVVRRAYP